MCLRKSQGCRCCKKVRGHLPEPEIQSVTVQIQLDGVHPKCTPHKSHSHTRTHHVGSQHTYTYRPCSTNPHHRWESLFNHTTWADQASVTPPTFYPPNTPPSLFWSLIPDPDSSPPVLIDWGLCVDAITTSRTSPKLKENGGSPCCPLPHKSAVPSNTLAA